MEEESDALNETILVLNGNERKIGGICLDYQGGCLYLIDDNPVDKFKIHFEVLLTGLVPSRVVYNIHTNEEAIDFIKELSVSQNFICDMLPSKYFRNNYNKKYISEFMNDIVDLQNGLLLSFINEMKNNEKLSMARSTFAALTSIVSNIERRDQKILELKDVIQKADLLLTDNHMYVNQETFYALNIFNESSFSTPLILGSKTCLFDIFNGFIGSVQGNKTLSNWFRFPLCNKELINNRLAVVKSLVSYQNSGHLNQLVKLMKKLTNINEIVSSLQKGKMSLRTWLNLKVFLEILIDISKLIELVSKSDKIELFTSFNKVCDLQHLEFLLQNINNTIDFDSSKDWKRVYVREGLNDALDKLKKRYNDLELTLNELSFQIINLYPDMEEESINAVYIPQLGFLISINQLSNGSIPVADDWVEVFRTSSSIYFKDIIMRNMDDNFGDVYQLLIDIEIEILFDLKTLILESSSALIHIGVQLSELDCFCSFASIALLNDFVKPEIVQDPIIMIKNGRNPIIEQYVNSYIANDTLLNSGVVSVITGANASGKSAYLAQIGIIIYLSHIGSYVPATKAEIGLTDKLLSKIITRESIDKCESTFFADLQNISKCLSLKTERSVLLIDEFGKGTDSVGGPSMLGAIIERVAQSNLVASRTILTTHFHELFKIDILKKLNNLKHDHMEIILTNEAEDSESITYLYNLKEGLAGNSFGIHCAQKCGIEKSIIKRAYSILSSEKSLEDNSKEISNVERLKVVTREFLLWDLEKETSAFEEIHSKLGSILANISTN